MSIEASGSAPVSNVEAPVSKAGTSVSKAESPNQPITFLPQNIWRIGFVLIALAAVALFIRFLLDDGGTVIFTVLMAWFAAIAMAPVVDRLAQHMRRGIATLIVMLSFLIAAVGFLFAFGALFLDQVVQIIQLAPSLVDDTIAWANQTFGLTLNIEQIKESMNLTSSNASELATRVGGEALGILGSVLGSFFGLFTVGLFTFYLSADMPRFRNWIARLFPTGVQEVVVNIWDITAQKTGGYVGARVVLALINCVTTAVVFYFIGMPYWLALALWTGIVAQFVPTIGTYIAIILPVIVGALSDNPLVGLYALIWALIYQQVENLTIEPKISARAVNVHPAVAFGSVLMGAALFGIAGAFLAVPVCAMLLALLSIYVKRHELAPGLEWQPMQELETAEPDEDETRADSANVPK